MFFNYPLFFKRIWSVPSLTFVSLVKFLAQYFGFSNNSLLQLIAILEFKFNATFKCFLLINLVRFYFLCDYFNLTIFTINALATDCFYYQW